MLPVIPLMLAALLSACSASITAPSGVQEVLPGYKIDLSPQALALRKDARVIEETVVADGVRPRFHHQVFLIDDSEIFGVFADVRIEFFNAQLLQIDLTPKSNADLAKTRKAMSTLYGVSESHLRNGVKTNGLQLHEARDATGRIYLSVTRRAILYQFREWLERYS